MLINRPLPGRCNNQIPDNTSRARSLLFLWSDKAVSGHIIHSVDKSIGSNSTLLCSRLGRCLCLCLCWGLLCYFRGGSRCNGISLLAASSLRRFSSLLSSSSFHRVLLKKVSQKKKVNEACYFYLMKFLGVFVKE